MLVELNEHEIKFINSVLSTVIKVNNHLTDQNPLNKEQNDAANAVAILIKEKLNAN